MTWGLGMTVLSALGLPASAAETPKHGGTLTYMIPADAPPSFDGHREVTFATVHSVAPFYSVLIRINPNNPSSTDDFVCDLCTEMPKPTDAGKTWTFKIRDSVKWHDGTPLTAADVAASWNSIVYPAPGVLSARASIYSMVDIITAPDPGTVVFKLKFATEAFLPALADAYAFVYKAETLAKDPHWYEKNILGSGPFKFTSYELGQSISGVRNPDYYLKGLPYLDGFVGIYAPKESTRVEAIRGNRAALEFRGLPPSAEQQLRKGAEDKIAVQTSDWNCVNNMTINHKRKPFDDVRVRRALALAIDQWKGAPALAKVTNIKTVGGIVFPGSPLAATKEELQKIAGFWPDIEKSRAEARRLLKEAGAENLSFELVVRNVDQPYKYTANWVIDEWSKIGVKVTQKVVPTGPWFEAMRGGTFDVVSESACQSLVNPILDVQKFLPTNVSPQNYNQYEDPKQVELYEKMLHETDPTKVRPAMRAFEDYTLDTAAHTLILVWWYRIVPYQSYVKGWKISPSHFVNQDLGTVWLDR
jgi:peptide/nickel transport system substrate-binding protein